MAVRRSRHRLLSLLSFLVAVSTWSPACAADAERLAATAAAHDARADSVARARQDSINRAQPGYVVDSARPIEEALRRFREGLGPSPAALVGGRPSRDELVRAFLGALERRDSLALERMRLSRAEYAYLVYPSSPLTRPPYRQQPEVAWTLLSAATDKGLRRLLDRRSRPEERFAGYSCPEAAVHEGENRLWRGCVVRRLRSPSDTASEALFGPIIERAGRFKFASYQNGL